MKKTFETYDGTILKEGKKYKWSGHSEGLYNGYSWSGFRCKVKKIDGGDIIIYDYEDEGQYRYTNDTLKEMGITFKKTIL